MPAINETLRRGAAVVVAVVLDRIDEVAHASVCESWPETCLRSLTDAVTQMKEHAAHVGKVSWRPRQWRRRLARRQQWRQGRTFRRVMRDSFDFYVLWKRFDCAEDTVLWIEAIWNSVRRFEIVTKHRQICEHESAEVDQNTLAFRMWQTFDPGDAQD